MQKDERTHVRIIDGKREIIIIKIKRRGQRTDPWGTSSIIRRSLDLNPDIVTYCLRSKRKERNQSRATPRIP